MNPSINIVGCGYIGKKIAAALNRKRKPVRCFVHSENSKLMCQYTGLDTYQFDLDQPDLSLNDDERLNFSDSILIYLVAPPKKGCEDTRMGNFLSNLKQLDLPPKKIVLISTTGIYGNCHGEWIDEDTVANPQADRAFRRLSAEQQLQKYAKKTQLIIFRVPGIYSKDKLPVERIMSGEPIVRAEDSGFTNRIHADDLVSFCVEALVSDVAAGIYNCCDGVPSTMNDYFKRVADALMLPHPAEISLAEAEKKLSAGMLSYLAESKRISNKKLLANFKTKFKYPNLEAGLKGI